MPSEEAVQPGDGRPSRPRKLAMWVKVCLVVFVCCAVALVIVVQRQSRVAAILKGIEDRGGYIERQPGFFTGLLSDILGSGNTSRDRRNGLPVSVRVIRPTVDELEMLGKFPSIKHLNLIGPASFESLIKTVRELPKLQSLSLYNFNLSDSDLERVITALPDPKLLTHVGFQNTVLTDKGLATLAKCPDLVTLYIDGSKIDGSGFSQLAELDLRLLTVRHSKLLDENLPLIVDQWGSSLNWIHLDHNPITDAGLESLEKIPGLTALGVGGTEVTPGAVKELLAGRKMQILTLEDLPWRMTDLEDLSLGTSLVHLDLSGWNINDEDLKSLPDLTGLSVLGLSRTGITDDGLRELQRYPALMTVTLDGTKISIKGLEQLVKISGLTSVSLGEPGVKFEDLLQMKDLGNLSFIKLYGTELTDEQLSELRGKHPRCTFVVGDRKFGL
ncbi:MAG: hypothetical protein KDA68_21400 [Planctomycetaceae bacterium]|nr:hypothetical protein [Planctomycetaceae bacterium]